MVIVVFPKDWCLNQGADVLVDARTPVIYLRQGCAIQAEPSSESAEQPLEEWKARINDALKNDAIGSLRSLFSVQMRGQSKLAATSFDADGLVWERIACGLLTLYDFARRRSGSAGGHWTGTAKTDEGRMLIARRFVEGLSTRVGRLRKGYLPRREDLSRIRGRVAPSSAARSEAIGHPRVTCCYHEFEHAVPIARVLSAALDIAIYDISAIVTPDSSATKEPQLLGKAQQCRATLVFVQETTPDEARALVSRLHLRLDERSTWEELIALARCLLFSQGPPSNRASQVPFQLTLDVAAAYEQWVFQALTTAAKGSNRAATASTEWSISADQVLQRPWDIKDTQARRADIIAEYRQQGDRYATMEIIIDCKHKLLDPTRGPVPGHGPTSDYADAASDDDENPDLSGMRIYRTPPIKDLYQISGYLFLRRDSTGEPIRAAVLVYLPETKKRGKDNWEGSSLVRNDTALEPLYLNGGFGTTYPRSWPWMGRTRPGTSPESMPSKNENALMIFRVPTPSPEELLAPDPGKDLGEAMLSRLAALCNDNYGPLA